MDVITCLSTYADTLKRPGVAKFADIIKITITLIKATFENSMKVKRITNHSRALRVSHVIYIFFGSSGTVIQIEKALINYDLRLSKAS